MKVTNGTIIDITIYSMDKQRMTFEIDHHSVTEGDVVEIRWQCDEAEKVVLTLDNGFRCSDIPLENNGSKRFRLNRSKGRTRLTITVTINGKEYKKTLRVRVKKMPVIHAETLNHQCRPTNSLSQWWQATLTKWHRLRQRIRFSLQSLPERKQIAIKLLIIIAVVLLLSAIWPKFYSIALGILTAYLILILFRR